MRAGIPLEVLRKDRIATLNYRQRLGFTMLELVVVVVIIAALAALLIWPATRTTGETARRTQCKNNLKQVGLALHNYHDRYGSFPPAFTVDAEGKPLHSWRTLILPFLDQEPLYNQIDLNKPWDDPVNAAASATQLDAYRCLSAVISPHLTTYLGVVGETAFFHPTATRKLADFGRLGTSEKIAVLDIDAEHAVPWMSPMDFTPEYLLTFGPKSKPSHPHGLHVLHVDGTVQFLSEDLPMEERQKMLVMPSESTREK